jgi:plastocyanin
MESIVKRNRVALAAIVLGLTVAACGGKDDAAEDHGNHDDHGDHAAAMASAGGTDAATPTGKVVTVELNSDEKGNYFKPNDFEVHRGDVIRFILKSGVHNVHFLPDSNPGKSGLPPASDMLQLPDQTLDIPVNLAQGKYYFQCDPHAALGMTGHVEVEH